MAGEDAEAEDVGLVASSFEMNLTRVEVLVLERRLDRVDVAAEDAAAQAQRRALSDWPRVGSSPLLSEL